MGGAGERAALVLLLSGGDIAVPAASAQPQGRLRSIFSSDLIANGVTQSASGRVFLPGQPPLNAPLETRPSRPQVTSSTSTRSGSGPTALCK